MVELATLGKAPKGGSKEVTSCPQHVITSERTIDTAMSLAALTVLSDRLNAILATAEAPHLPPPPIFAP